MQKNALTTLEAGLESIGLELDAAKLDALIGYHDFLMQVNASMNLTGHKEEAKSVVNNLLNSLAPVALVTPELHTADIGSGGGLPGIPLAIALEMPRMTLVESKEKKCRFLQDACQRFSPTTKVLQSDVNEIREPFEQIVSVAFAPLEKLLRVTKSCRTRDTRVLAWKGALETIEREIAACDKRDAKLFAIEPFEVPGLDSVQRHLCTYPQRG